MTGPSPSSDPLRVAVVLGAAVWAGGAPSPTLLRRTRAAAALYHAGGVDLMVPTGGLGLHAPTEAEAMADILHREGVPETAILLETQATTTLESARLVAAVLAEHGPVRVTLVSDGYHLARARLAFAAHGLRGTTHAAGRAKPRPRPIVAAKFWARECVALPYYALRIATGRR